MRVNECDGDQAGVSDSVAYWKGHWEPEGEFFKTTLGSVVRHGYQ